MPHNIAVRAIRLRRHDDTLGCDVSKIVGYRAACSCGWRGGGRACHGAAAVEGKWHRRDHGR
jgi:hypothetical protein